MTIKAIISDIDGTILDNHHQIDTDLPKQIKKLTEIGIPFILSSARSPLGILPISNEIGNLDTPISCYNGALITKPINHQFDTIIEHSLNLNDVKKMVTLLNKDFPHIGINLYSNEKWYTENCNKWVQLEASITSETPLVVDFNELFHNKSFKAHKFLLIAEEVEIQEFLSVLNSESFEDMSFYLSKSNYLEITSKLVSKENALTEIAHFYHITPDDIMAIGDNFNDLPMIKRAGIGVAMGNAPLEIQEKADYITDTNTHNGVSKAITKFVLNPD